jgi:hypothetical protein
MSMNFSPTARMVSAAPLMLAALCSPLLFTACGGGDRNAGPDGSSAAPAAATARHPLAATASGKTYHVDSTAGSDTDNGESAATPWKSLGRLKNLALRDGVSALAGLLMFSGMSPNRVGPDAASADALVTLGARCWPAPPAPSVSSLAPKPACAAAPAWSISKDGPSPPPATAFACRRIPRGWCG